MLLSTGTRWHHRSAIIFSGLIIKTQWTSRTDQFELLRVIDSISGLAHSHLHGRNRYNLIYLRQNLLTTSCGSRRAVTQLEEGAIWEYTPWGGGNVKGGLRRFALSLLLYRERLLEEEGQRLNWVMTRLPQFSHMKACKPWMQPRTSDWLRLRFGDSHVVSSAVLLIMI